MKTKIILFSLLCIPFLTSTILPRNNIQTQKNIIKHMAELDIQMRNIASQIAIGYDIEAGRSAKRLLRAAKKYDAIYKRALPVVGNSNRKVNTSQQMKELRKESTKLYKVITQNRGNYQKMLNQYSRVVKSCRACHKKLEVNY